MSLHESSNAYHSVFFFSFSDSNLSLIATRLKYRGQIPIIVLASEFISAVFFVLLQARPRVFAISNIKFIGSAAEKNIYVKHRKIKIGHTFVWPICSPSWARTNDPLINSQVL